MVNRLVQLGALWTGNRKYHQFRQNNFHLSLLIQVRLINWVRVVYFFIGLGKALVLSHALGCSKDVLTSAAGVEERFLRAPRFEDEKEIFMNFVRDLRLKFSDDHSLCCIYLAFSSLINLVSISRIQKWNSFQTCPSREFQKSVIV